MVYHIFVDPNPLYFYPKPVINSIINYGNASVVITLDKEYLLSKSSTTQFIERIQQDGSVLNNDNILEFIRDFNPHCVVLDNCFWDNETVNTELLMGLFELKQFLNFMLINVLPISVFNEIQMQSLVLQDLANNVYFPRCRLSQSSFSLRWSYKTIFYDNNKLESNKAHFYLPTVEPDVYKLAEFLFRDIQSIRLRNDFDLFTLFLEGLRCKYHDQYFSRFVFIFRKYLCEMAINGPIKKECFTVAEYNDMFEVLNRPIFLLIIHSRHIYDEIASFFRVK